MPDTPSDLGSGSAARAPTTSKALRLAVDGPVATVELTRPERRNALSPHSVRDLLTALADVALAADVRVVVLTGAGDGFCAGADLVDLDPQHLGEAMTQCQPHHSCPAQPAPARHRQGTRRRRRRWVQPHPRLRIRPRRRDRALLPDLPADRPVHRPRWQLVLPRLVGLRRARELALLGDDLDGPTAAQVGLITRCVSRDELDDAVDRLAIRLADYSLQAQARTKHLLDATWSFALTEALAAEAEAQVANVSTPEFHRALNAFRTRHQGAQP